MKKNLAFLICLFIFQINLKSQDVIRLKDGDSLNCRITKIDSSKIYFKFEKNHKQYQTCVEKDRILNYEYNSLEKKINPNLRSSKSDFFLLSIDPLGFITMGPSFCGEFLLQNKTSSVGFGIYSGIRITNLGLTTHLLLGWGEEKISYTVPLAFRVYPKTRNKSDGYFIGPHVEFGQTNFVIGRQYKILAYGAEFGYKWVNKNGLTIEISDAIGVAQRKKLPFTLNENGSSTPIAGTDWETIAFVPYMLSVKIGYTFNDLSLKTSAQSNEY